MTYNSNNFLRSGTTPLSFSLTTTTLVLSLNLSGSQTIWVYVMHVFMKNTSLSEGSLKCLSFDLTCLLYICDDSSCDELVHKNGDLPASVFCLLYADFTFKPISQDSYS